MYGLTDSQTVASNELFTPRSSSTCTMQTALPRNMKIKLESGLEAPIVENVRF